MVHEFASHSGGSWKDTSFAFKERSIVDMNIDRGNIIDIRFAQHQLGIQNDLVKISGLHKALRERSKDFNSHEECVLWYRTGNGRKRSFDEVAQLYKLSLFMDISKELAKLSIGTQIGSDPRSKASWFIETHAVEEKLHGLNCLVMTIFAKLATELDFGAMVTYVHHRLRGDPMLEVKPFRKPKTSAVPYALVYDQIMNEVGKLTVSEQAQFVQECQTEEPYWSSEIVTLHNDIYIFLQGILAAPTSPRSVTLWRYLNAVSPLLLTKYTEVGNIVPVDRFLSTGTSPVDPGRTSGILLRIDLPPEFPFWTLSGEIERTVSLEHREVVLPYTTDVTGQTLDYGLRVKKIIKSPELRAENSLLRPDYLIYVEPTPIKPIRLQGFRPTCIR